MRFDTDVRRGIFKHFDSLDVTMFVEGMDRDHLSDEWFEPRIYPIRYSETPGQTTIYARLNILCIVTLPKVDIYKMSKLKDKIIDRVNVPIPIYDESDDFLFCLQKYEHTTEDYGQPNPAIKLEQSLIKVPCEGYYEH